MTSFWKRISTFKKCYPVVASALLFCRRASTCLVVTAAAVAPLRLPPPNRLVHSCPRTATLPIVASLRLLPPRRLVHSSCRPPTATLAVTGHLELRPSPRKTAGSGQSRTPWPRPSRSAASSRRGCGPLAAYLGLHDRDQRRQRPRTANICTRK